MMGSALGTPAYMPPEQAAGKLDQLGPASDVYSLGATLYHLLTGKAPFKTESLEETLKAVQTGQFPRPSEINASVPKSLEAVCLKAMSLKSRDRYASPQDLADDIERYLADEPVQAFPEPFALKAKRWVRKHPTLTTTTAAVVLLSALGLGTFSSILGAKNTELSQLNDDLRDSNIELADKNAELDQANLDLTAANRREIDARELAQDNELAAREQSQLALSTLTSVILDVQKGFENLPGGGEVRRRLLATSLQKLEQVATEYVEQATVDRSTMVALIDMGDVIQQFGVGEQAEALVIDAAAEATQLTAEQQSAVELAHEFYTRAHDIAQSLAAADPTNSVAQRDLSISYERLGDVQLRLGDMRSALQFFEQKLNIDKHLAESETTNAQAQQDLSVSYGRLGIASFQLGQTAEAIAFYQQQLDILQALASSDLSNVEAQRDLLISYSKLADVYLYMLADPQSALDFYQQGLDACEALVAQDPTNAESQRYRAVSLSNVGDAYLQQGKLEPALDYYSQCHDVQVLLAAADPNYIEAQRDLAISFLRLGDVHRQSGNTLSALDFFRRSNEICESLAAQDPSNIQAQRDLAVSCSRMGDVHLQLGEPQSALEFYERDLIIAKVLAAADMTNAELQRDLMVSYYNLAFVSSALHDYDATIENYTMAIAILDRMIATGQNVAQSQQEREIVANELRTVERDAAQARVALEVWDVFISRPGARSRLSLRIQLLARAGRFNDIPQSAEMLRSLDAENPDNLYNAACGYALCANAISAAEGEELAREEQTQRQEYINLALACLRESIAAGWSDFDHMRQDPDLAVLRELREFEEMLHTPPPPPVAE